MHKSRPRWLLKSMKNEVATQVMKRIKNTNFKTASARDCSNNIDIGRFWHRQAPVDMKGKMGEAHKSVNFLFPLR